MANYSELIATINDQVKANGNQEITGPVLNAVLQAMVSALGEGYQFMGVATPDTNPGTPDQKVFYLASQKGNYANFNTVIDDGGLYILIFVSGQWQKNDLEVQSARHANVNVPLDSSILNRYIYELYLTGLNPAHEYKINSYGVYDSGEVKRQTFVISDFTDGEKAVAQADTLLSNRGVVEVFSLADSGISGYAIFNFYDLNSIEMTYNNYIDNAKVSAMLNSPAIYAYLLKQEVSAISEVLSSKSTVPIDIDYGAAEAYNADNDFQYIGYNHPMTADVLLQSISFGVSPDDMYVGKQLYIYTGFIDQRGWFITDTIVLATVTSYTGNIATVEPNEKTIIRQGDIVLVESGTNWMFQAVVDAVKQKYGSFVHINPANLPEGCTQRNDVSLRVFKVNTVEFSSIFATEDELKEIEEKVQSNATAIQASNIYIDEITGSRYRLSVKNGQISLNSLSVNKIWFIGNSFTQHGSAADLWWGNGRGMAASVDATQYTQLIADITGATIKKGNYASFETSYSPDFDFAGTFNIDDGGSYDLVVVQLNENAAYSETMQSSWEALYDYIRSVCPNANIIQIIGWYNADKYSAISNAAINKGVTLIDCSYYTGLGQYALGDYVTGSDGVYHAISNSGVTAHPSDIGLYYIAKMILQSYYLDINKIHTLTIADDSDVEITLPYNQWIEGGVVNVRVNSEVNNVTYSFNSASHNATKRDDTHYTFVMPGYDVIISAM